MVPEGNDFREQEMPPPPDESWWEAVLAEDIGIPTRTTGIKDVHMEFNEIQPIEQQRPNTVDEIDWDLAIEIFKLDQVTELEVAGYNRGGLLVKGQGLQGFVPLSHLIDVPSEQEEEIESNLIAYQNRTVQLKMIECEYESGRIIFSERAAQTEPGKRIELLKSLQSGDQISGKVSNITDFGIFVDLGGMEGLVHVSEISWGRVHHPSDVVTIGQVVDVYVINVDRAKSRVALSIKRLKSNPWETADERYYPGQLVEAVVTNVVSYGVFARLEDGLDGLIHNSEMLKETDGSKPGMNLEKGQKIQVRILNVDISKQRIGMSLNLIH